MSDERFLRINQIKYLKKILKRFQMEECKPTRVPFDPKVKLERNANGNDESKGFPYQQAVGSLNMPCCAHDSTWHTQ
jgi:hypothetical protein